MIATAAATHGRARRAQRAHAQRDADEWAVSVEWAVRDCARCQGALPHQLSGVPQLAQNLAPGAAAVPHWVQ
jgi:hypothetical protein